MTINRGSDGQFLPDYVFDPFDPRGWEIDIPYRGLQLHDRDESLFCVLDRDDWEWASLHLWRCSRNSWGKPYASRVVIHPHGRRENVWLHKEVLRRHRVPTSDEHSIGDHMNGRSLDNRLSNLRWATADENNRNKFGFYVFQLHMQLDGGQCGTSM